MNLGFAPPKGERLAGAEGVIVVPGDTEGTDTFGLRGCSFGGWPSEDGGGGGGGGCKPLLLPGGMGGPSK